MFEESTIEQREQKLLRRGIKRSRVLARQIQFEHYKLNSFLGRQLIKRGRIQHTTDRPLSIMDLTSLKNI